MHATSRGGSVSRGGGMAGLTLTEVLVSMGIFALAIPAVLAGMLAGYGVIKKNAHQIAALNLARKKMEYVMNIQYSSLSTASNAYSETNVPLESNSKIRANVNVTVTNPSGTTRKNITVNVRWAEQGRTFNVTLFTLVSKNNVS